MLYTSSDRERESKHGNRALWCLFMTDLIKMPRQALMCSVSSTTTVLLRRRIQLLHEMETCNVTTISDSVVGVILFYSIPLLYISSPSNSWLSL